MRPLFWDQIARARAEDLPAEAERVRTRLAARANLNGHREAKRGGLRPIRLGRGLLAWGAPTRRLRAIR